MTASDTLKPYLSLARFDNWTKNLLMLAGAALAYFLMDSSPPIRILPVLWGAASLCFASSANYILNEAIDARFDRFHPIKKSRASVQHQLNPQWIIAEYGLFASAALAMASLVDMHLVFVIGFYLVCAWAYNIPPLRLKDVAYADVLMESINYPLRILAGWLCVLPGALPPSSIFLLGWTIGGFTMSVKRLAEYQVFTDLSQAVAYRKSYQTYTVSKLVCVSLLYAMLSGFNIAIFLIKYHIEFLLAFPFISLWFMWYLSLGMNRSENAIYPEKLFRQRKLLALSIGILVLLIVLARTTLPQLHIFGEPLYFSGAAALVG